MNAIAIPVVDRMVMAIITQLDAVLDAIGMTHAQLSFLPPADNFALVDGAVRTWARMRGATASPTRRHNLRADGTGTETYHVVVRGEYVVTVHVPEEIQRTQDALRGAEVRQ